MRFCSLVWLILFVLKLAVNIKETRFVFSIV